MPTVKVTQSIIGEPEHLFKKVRNYCDEKLVIEEAGHFKPKIKWDTKKQTGEFDGKGFRGTISIASNPSNMIMVVLEIPFLMLPFKKLVTESIRHHLAKIT